jgi:hypothetical protein
MSRISPETAAAIKQQQQQTIDNAALAAASTQAMKAQAAVEFAKSMAEMGAKSVKSSGEALKGLA